VYRQISPAQLASATLICKSKPGRQLRVLFVLPRDRFAAYATGPNFLRSSSIWEFSHCANDSG
jgi:hypothetical protein